MDYSATVVSRVILVLSAFAVMVIPSVVSAQIKDLETVPVTGNRPDFPGVDIAGGAGGGGGFEKNLNSPFPILSTEDGGGGISTNEGDPGQQTQPKDCRGNPVALFTGNKLESETDFSSIGEMGLFLTRTYNHHWIGRGLFGQHWISNFDFSLTHGDGYKWIQYPDGRRIKFRPNYNGTGWVEDKAAPIAEITLDGTDYLLRNESGGVERYNEYGQIIELKNRHGVAWRFAYSDRLLQSVTHSSGRQVKFFWSGMQVVRVVDPDGAEFHYTYQSNAFGPNKGRLESVRLPGAPETIVSYLYEDPRFIGGLTGKVFNGQRYSRFAYDALGRATLTEHEGGVEKYVFEYDVKATEQVVSPPLPVPPGGYREGDLWPDGGGCTWGANGRYCTNPEIPTSGAFAASSTVQSLPTKEIASEFAVKEVGPLGRSAMYTFVSGRLVKTVGTGSCPQTNVEKRYDTRGYLQQATNARGIDTAYIHDDKGLLLSRTEAILTAQERVTRFEWDAVTNLPKRELLVDVSSKDFTYTENGRVASIALTNLSGKGVAGERRVTSFNYTLSANGMVAIQEVDGPLPGNKDKVTLYYDGFGNLIREENGLGHRTIYSGHNGRGQPGRIVGPNEEITEFTYDARGRVVAMRVGSDSALSEIRYAYTAMGRLALVTTPDGLEIRNFYDAAGRLIKTSTPESVNVSVHRTYTYNAASNITEVKVTRDTPPVPQAPAVVIGSSFTVKWIAQPGAVRYVLQESKDGGGWADVYSGSSLEWSASGRPPGSYSYRIVACTADGQCSPGYISEEPVVVKPDLSPIINYLLNS